MNPENLKKRMEKKRDKKIEERDAKIVKRLTEKMKKEKELRRNKGKEDEIQKKYQQITKAKKEKIRIKLNSRYQKKFEKMLSNPIPNSRKMVTRMLGSLQDKRGNPDISKLISRKKIETDRLLFGQVTNKDIMRLVLLNYIRESVRWTQDQALYNDIKKVMKKKIPEMIIP